MSLTDYFVVEAQQRVSSKPLITSLFYPLARKVSMNKQLLEVVEKTLKERDDAEEGEAVEAA